MKKAIKLLAFAFILSGMAKASSKAVDPDFQKPQVYITRACFIRVCMVELVNKKDWDTVKALSLWAKHQPATMWCPDGKIFPGWRKK
ncbi:Uncharacterised protein [uncultured archaeon]|nr:Uncharacterised protein [uncultured archaeon]